MLSLIFLDHHSWWTSLGLAIKFGSIIAIVALGVASFLYSNPVFYFTTYWLLLVFTPQVILLVADDHTHNICMEFGRVMPCKNHLGVVFWLTIAMFEIVFIWIPLLGFAARAIRKSYDSQFNPTVEADARKSDARGSP